MPNVVVQLSEPIIGHPDPKVPGHDGKIRQVTLREPKYFEIMKFGEPYSRGFAADGSVIYTAENIEIIRSYIEACAVDVDVLLLNQLKMSDTLRLKDALLSFFSDARSKPSDGKSIS